LEAIDESSLTSRIVLLRFLAGNSGLLQSNGRLAALWSLATDTLPKSGSLTSQLKLVLEKLATHFGSIVPANGHPLVSDKNV
jgi:hypothetical protein